VSTETETKPKATDVLPRTFRANGRIRLVRVAEDRQALSRASSQKLPGLAYEFTAPEGASRSGELVVTEDIIRRDREFFEKYDPTFPKDGTGDPMTLQWLRNHNYMGERMWEIPPEAPAAGPILSQVTQAGVRGDVDALVKLYEQEETTFKRAEILEPITAALDAIEEAKAAASQPGEPSAAVGTAPGSTSDLPQAFRPPIEE
jgi:hypothetical protein